MVEHLPGLFKALSYIPRTKGGDGGGEDNRRTNISDIILRSVEDYNLVSTCVHILVLPLTVTSDKIYVF